MASYDGTLVDNPHRAEDAWRNISVNVETGQAIHTITFPPEEIHSVVPLAQSDWTFVQQGENETAYTGTKAISFLDDYYYRVHISPASIAFGAIVSPSEEEFIVWNAWFETKSCTDITKTSEDEYTLDPEAIFDLMSLEYETFTILVDTDGSATFDATVTFTFDSEAPVLTLSGTRVAIFPFSPKIPMTESLEWLTNIITSRDGSEQRISLRPTPRQSFKFNVLLTSEQEQAQLEALMFQWTKRMWGIPIWGEWESHSDTINIGDTTITLDTTDADFRDDSYAIIWQDHDSYEVIKIETMADDSLTLEFPIVSQWTGNKHIMPIRTGYMISPSNMRIDADGYAEFDCNFIVQDNELITTHTADEEYDSLTVLEASHEQGGLDNKIDGDVRIIDFGMDDFSLISDSDYNVYIQQHAFRKLGKSEIWAFRELLHSLYGRQGVCWILTDKEDFVQAQTLGAAETELRVSNVGWARNMTLNSMRTHIAFVFSDGRRYYREITGLTEDDTEDIIGIDSALGIQIEPGDCNICLLDKCRLTEDKIDIEWQEPFSIVSKINFTKVTE